KIRSNLKKTGAIQTVLKNLKLDKLYSCVLLDKSESNLGMFKVAESVLTYGEIDKETLKKLLMRRSMLSNKKRYEWKEAELTAFVEDLLAGKKSLSDIKVKKIFHLHPPIKGFERNGKKAPYKLKGASGYRGNDINGLLQRMI
ncbi:hypothetical protein M1316_01780, partial [Candidatus Parvarchaeota archaeon]|nr:hypothetical protein [Candidatus Parvarchaeota archaeon]